MRRGGIGAPGAQAAVVLDQRELLGGGERDAVLHRELVERAGEGAFHAGAVVAPDVDDQGVVEFAHLLDRVEQAPDVPVGVLLEAGVDLHLPGVELLLLRGQRVPGRERGRPRGELGVARDHAEPLLPGEGLLTVGVPAVVEPAPVLIAPLGWHLVRRVAAAGGVVQEPGLVRILGAHGMQPARGLVGQVVRQVVLLAVLALGHADDRVVLGDDRVVLARFAGQEAPEVVKAPGVRPAVERAGRALHVIRCHVPLAEARRAVPVALQHADERRAVLRAGRGVARERARQLADRPEAHAVVVAAGEHRRPGRRAQCGHMEAVIGQPSLGDPRHGRRIDRAAEGARVAEPGIVDQHQQHVRRVVGRRRGHVDGPVGLRLRQRAADRAPEGRVRDRQHRAVGAELAGGRRQRLLEGADAVVLHLGDGLHRRAGQRLLGRQPVGVVDDGDDAGRARRELLPDPRLDAALYTVPGERARHAAGRRPDHGRGEQRRREQADHDTHPAAPAESLAP